MPCADFLPRLAGIPGERLRAQRRHYQKTMALQKYAVLDQEIV